MVEMFAAVVGLGVSVSQAMDFNSLLLGGAAGGLAAATGMWFKMRALKAAEAALDHKVQVQFQLITALENKLAVKEKEISELEMSSLKKTLRRADEHAQRNDFALETKSLLDWWTSQNDALSKLAGRLGEKWAGFGHHSEMVVREAHTLFQIASMIDTKSDQWRENAAAIADTVKEMPASDEKTALDLYKAELRESRPETAETIFAELENAVQRLIDARQYLQALKTATRAGRVMELGHPAPDDAKRARAMWLWAKAAMHAGKLDDALAIAEESLDTRKRVLPADDPQSLDSAALVAQVLTRLDRHEEALTQAQSVLDTRKRVLSDEHVDTLAAAALVAQIAQKLGKSDAPLAKTEAEATADTTEQRRSRLRIVTSEDTAETKPTKAKTPSKRRRKKAEAAAEDKPVMKVVAG
jgi:hypothetical protein